MSGAVVVRWRGNAWEGLGSSTMERWYRSDELQKCSGAVTQWWCVGGEVWRWRCSDAVVVRRWRGVEVRVEWRSGGA